MQRTFHRSGSPRDPVIEKRQVVAGFVIFRRTVEGVKFLLLYKRGSYWNFPKGHFEIGETSLSAALRETEEETGIKPSELHIIPEFRAYERFTFQSGRERVHDKVILFLAETKKADIRISTREHSGFAWFFYKDAVRILPKKYEATRRVLRQARDFLRGSGVRCGARHSARRSTHVSSGGAPRRQATRVPSRGEHFKSQR